MIQKIGMGGGCHWCTEAVFQTLKGVTRVEQGYISSYGDASAFSEAVLISFRPEIIPLKILIEIHLLTHQSSSNHSFRKKYRSAVYPLNPQDEALSLKIIRDLQRKAESPIITEVHPFREFKASRESLRNYYFSDPQRPFCQRYIEPKIQMLLIKFSKEIDEGKF